MSSKEVDAVKRYFDFHLVKRFIKTSLVSYSLPVLFVKKSKGRIRFYINYTRLNAIIKNNCYPIPLIQEILTPLEGAKYFTRIDLSSFLLNKNI